MAEETVDAAIKACNLKPKNGCLTQGLILEGGNDRKFLFFSFHIYSFNALFYYFKDITGKTRN